VQERLRRPDIEARYMRWVSGSQGPDASVGDRTGAAAEPRTQGTDRLLTGVSCLAAVMRLRTDTARSS